MDRERHLALSRAVRGIGVAVFWLPLLGVTGCERGNSVTRIAATDSELDVPKDYIAWVYRDENAKAFVEKCKQARPETAAGVCEQLLYAERAKQVWAAQTYMDRVGTVTEKTAPDGKTVRISQQPDLPDVMRASEFVPDLFYKDEPWIWLADIYKLSESERERVEAAITRRNTQRFNAAENKFESAIPDD